MVANATARFLFLLLQKMLSATMLSDIVKRKRVEREKDVKMQALGELGGFARKRVLSAERRSEIARLAAKVRWAKKYER